MNSYNGFSPAQRTRALNWLKGQYAAGLRMRPTQCDACGQTHGIVEHHSEDYSEPFGDHIGQYALCYRCHMMVHCRFKNPVAWDVYIELLQRNLRFKGMTARNFPRFTEECLRYSQNETLLEWADNANPKVLEEIEHGSSRA